ncbi:hypothetical protein TWF694_008093 [Orbilia ellipsospora]|uniref:Uncharacterized protein n=1 Tax=Orbilia ellipsospora TaxID=2528407 RepID=A0AAV9XGB3_9PEZI
MQLNTILAVTIAALTPLVSATAYRCTNGGSFYCCSVSGPFGGCVASTASLGCQPTAPYPVCCLGPGYSCTFAPTANSCACPPAYTCPC